MYDRLLCSYNDVIKGIFMSNKKTVTVISDDYYFLHGLQCLLLSYRAFEVKCQYIHAELDLSMNETEHLHILKDNSVVLLALDNLRAMEKFSSLFSGRVIYLLRTLSRSNMVVFFMGALVASRYVTTSRLFRLLDNLIYSSIINEEYLTYKEEQIVFNYFSMGSTQLNNFKNNIGIKRLSYYKRSAYRKLMVHGDADAHFIVRALISIKVCLSLRKESSLYFCG